MSDDLHALEAWAGALLAKLQPAQRRAINHKVAIDLRRSQAQRIKAQQGPDGTAYPARKRRKEFKGRNGRIKRQKAAMFAKIRTTKYLKVQASPNQLSVGFIDKVTYLARVHHEGLADNVVEKGPEIQLSVTPTSRNERDSSNIDSYVPLASPRAKLT